MMRLNGQLSAYDLTVPAVVRGILQPFYRALWHDDLSKSLNLYGEWLKLVQCAGCPEPSSALLEFWRSLGTVRWEDGRWSRLCYTVRPVWAAPREIVAYYSRKSEHGVDRLELSIQTARPDGVPVYDVVWDLDEPCHPSLRQCVDDWTRFHGEWQGRKGGAVAETPAVSKAVVEPIGSVCVPSESMGTPVAATWVDATHATRSTPLTLTAHACQSDQMVPTPVGAPAPVPNAIIRTHEVSFEDFFGKYAGVMVDSLRAMGAGVGVGRDGVGADIFKKIVELCNRYRTGPPAGWDVDSWWRNVLSDFYLMPSLGWGSSAGNPDVHRYVFLLDRHDQDGIRLKLICRRVDSFLPSVELRAIPAPGLRAVHVSVRAIDLVAGEETAALREVWRDLDRLLSADEPTVPEEQAPQPAANVLPPYDTDAALQRLAEDLAASEDDNETRCQEFEKGLQDLSGRLDLIYQRLEGLEACRETVQQPFQPQQQPQQTTPPQTCVVTPDYSAALVRLHDLALGLVDDIKLLWALARPAEPAEPTDAEDVVKEALKRCNAEQKDRIYAQLKIQVCDSCERIGCECEACDDCGCVPCTCDGLDDYEDDDDEDEDDDDEDEDDDDEDDEFVDEEDEDDDCDD